MKKCIANKVGMLLSVMLLVFACCGCAEKEQSNAEDIHIKDRVTVSESQKAETAVVELEEAKNGKVPVEDIHDGYEIVSMEEWRNARCVYTDIICPAFQINAEEADNMSTLEWIMFFANNMELTEIAGTQTFYEREDIRFANADTDFWKSVLKDPKEPNWGIDIDFNYGEEGNSIWIIANVDYEDGIMDYRGFNVFAEPGSHFYLRDENAQKEVRIDDFAAALLSKNHMSETVE